jgi:hypothetical protein
MAVAPVKSKPESGGKKSPQNQKLWDMLTRQASAKFTPYPSLPASKWIHNEYVKRGGAFIEEKKKATPQRKAHSRGHSEDDKKAAPKKKGR